VESTLLRAAERLDDADGRPGGLAGDEIHVWFASLRVPDAVLGALDRTLSPDERDRANQFRHPRDRREFLAAHGIARAILSRYTGTAPRELTLERNAAGRPALAQAPGAPALGFSMSHSGTAALFGVARERSVGVDIELIDRRLIDEEAAERILSPSERASLGALPPQARTHARFRLWTLKEALLKARGEGLAIPPSSIDLSAALSGAATIPATGAWDDRGILWTLAVIPAPPGYAAAAACRGGGYRVICKLFGESAAESSAAAPFV
jgi:4'-phosphopantetheinyl transferase